MSVWFLRNNHTCIRLDTVSIDEAIDRIQDLVDTQGGYGYVGTHMVTPCRVIRWSPGQPWRGRVRDLLMRHQGAALPTSLLVETLAARAQSEGK